MIDFLFAEKNINNYKHDYAGYLVIVDKIRTIDVLQSKDVKKMQEHLKHLRHRYQKEINIIKKQENEEIIKKNNVFKLSKEQLIKELNYYFKCLPVIGFIVLGKEKEIGINYQSLK